MLYGMPPKPKPKPKVKSQVRKVKPKAAPASEGAELDFLPVLWSAYPLHPHRPGNPLSNRTPSSSEAAAWSWSWRALIDVFSIRSVVAVGNVSRDTLARSGLSVPHVRHPAHGGREKFTLGLRDLLARGVIA